MAQVIDTTGKKTTANTTVAKNPITTPQQALNYIIKTPTNTITTKNSISSLSPSTLPNIAKQAANDAKANIGNGAVLGALGAFNFANGGGTPANSDPADAGGDVPADNPPAGGGGGDVPVLSAGSGGGNYSSGGYTNPRSGGISMVGGSSYIPSTPAADTAQTDVALPEETSFEAKLKELLATNNDSAKTAYETAKEDTDSYLEQQLREAYISRMLAEKALPQQMAAQGINGGAVESILAGNRNNYMNNRNDIYKTANEKLRGIANTYQNNITDNQKAYTASLADYLNQIDMLRRQADIDKELAAYKAQFG